MPLLKKRSFEKISAPEFLRDDEEVFYCEITNEIFRNYEEFAERMLLCTSMVWTCAMTGKSNLTYEEALESEENAKKMIKEFPVELRIPILYVGCKTKRTGFGEMAEDVFLYCKDRFFIGEKLESSFTGNKWVESHVLQVIAPSNEVTKKSPKNGSNEKDKSPNPPANLYKYEIEHLDADDEDISEIMIVDFNQIRRRKAVFNRERCKLFLKQYVEQDANSHWVIKQSAMKEFGIDQMKFENIFSGPEPNFVSSKKFEKKTDPKKPTTPVNGKKSRQETLAKYLTKVNNGAAIEKVVETKTKSNDSDAKNNGAKKNNNSVLLEQMEKRKEEFARAKQMKEEAKNEMKKQQKEVNLQISQQLKEWHKQKEDLELEDQQILPTFPPVKSRIPDEIMGDVMMLLEFIKSFEKILKCKNFFQQGLTFDIMERALVEEEVAGPLIDLIQMFLTALFREQEEENAEYSMQLAKPVFLGKIDVKNMSMEEASRFAILAAKWPKERQGLSLRNLPLYSLTLTEVLRLHLLSSGARLTESGERGRFSQRGGYGCTDDPGLYMRWKRPDVVRALAVKSVVQLKVKDKISILTTLMYQLLTYADFRDAIEDRIEKTRQVRLDLRTAQTSDRKRENEYNAAKWQMKRQAKINKEDPKATAKALEALTAAEEKRKTEAEKQIETYFKSAYDKEMLLGMDRAYRKYYKLESIPGVFVDSEEDHPGVCLPEPVKQVPELVNADNKALVEHLRRNLHKLNSSDKENTPSKKSPKKINGDLTIEADVAACNSDKLLMCTSQPKTCPVHSLTDREGPLWMLLPRVESLDKLTSALNKRGLRENELLQTLNNDKETLSKFVRQTPVQQLNPDLDIEVTEEAKPRVATRGKKSYMDANFGFPTGTTIENILRNTLTDDILEMEEKIYSGSLGQLHVKNRDAWRNILSNKNYAQFNREIIRRQYSTNGADLVKMEENDEEDDTGAASGAGGVFGGQTANASDIKCRYSNFDPGTFLGPDGEEEQDLEVGEEVREAVECLAIALAQVAQAVEPKFLQKPLGDSSDKNLATYVPSRNRLDNWEQSLLNSTSFSQVFLHYSTLDSCVMWSRSTLLAKCKICRRQKDSENMLLCDSCNMGHHLYCLKPKLTSIPKGDWFCDRCTAAREKERRKAGGEVIPKKKRRLFKEEEQEEEEEDDDDVEEEQVKEENSEEEESGEEEAANNEDSDEEDDEESVKSENDDEEESAPRVKTELCAACNSGGSLITCDECDTSYHKECADPPLRRLKSNWVCRDCKTGGVSAETTRQDGRRGLDNNNGRSSRSSAGGGGGKNSGRSKRSNGIVHDASTSDSDDYPLAHHAATATTTSSCGDVGVVGAVIVVNNERRSAARARHNIHNFVRSLRRISTSDDDSNADDSHHYNSQRKRSHRRESGRDDLPLHNAALQDLLAEVMKHQDAWPFLRPVQRNEVPDYHEVIANPMDFGTIKYKLNMGEYTTDSQLMRDAALVFENCNTYNEYNSEIYKCGERLLESFRSKCLDLGLKIPSRNSVDDETNKKRRTK